MTSSKGIEEAPAVAPVPPSHSREVIPMTPVSSDVDNRVNYPYGATMAEVELTPAATKQADRLPRPIRRRIMRLVRRLESWPAVSGAKALTGNLAGSHRLRTGDYRLQFRVVGDTVIIDHIGHRDGFYEG